MSASGSCNMNFALLVLLAIVSFATAQQCDSDSSTVLILGGGMAGVAAAHRLNELGVTNFVLLEAQDRLGGRIRSEELLPGVNVNVGANWIHGVDAADPMLHPLYALSMRCTEGGLEGFVTDYDSVTTYDENGTTVLDSSLRYDAFEAAVDSVYNVDRDPDISVREGFTQSGWTPTTPNDRWVEWYDFDFCFAARPEIVSLEGYFQEATYEDFLASPNNTAEDFLITDNRGSVFLVECLANEFTNNNIAGDSRIHLNTRVTLIERGDDCVCVTAQENGGTTQYCARYAIVTFSTGVLKAQMNTLFSPPLSTAKQNALNLLENGFYYVIWVAFQTRFWDTGYVAIGHIAAEKGYFPIIFTHPVNSSRSNIVHLHLTEEVAERIAGMTDDQIRVEIGDLFRAIYGPSSPDPIAITSMRWLLDDLFLGSYSFPLVGGLSAYEEMARPEGRIYFSGEGSSAEYYGYMHGSLLSGVAAAEAIAGDMHITGNFVLVLVLAACKILFL